jgi:hypothetical protein
VDYLPYITVSDNRFDLLEVHVALDWNGREFNCVFQRKLDDGTFERPSVSYYPLRQEWCCGWPTANPLTAQLHAMMKAFDLTGAVPAYNPTKPAPETDDMEGAGCVCS